MNYTIADYYYDCYNNVIDMCIDRNYTSSTPLSTLKLSRDAFNEKYEKHEKENYNALDIEPNLIVDNKGKPVYITFIEHTRENKSFIKNIVTGIINVLKNYFNFNKNQIVQRQELLENFHCIVIHSNEIKPGSQYHHNFELFSTKTFFINITRHYIVPQHILLKEDERKLIFETKNMTHATCPKIFTDDPVNLYYNGQPGQVYKIIRESKGVYFRVVVGGKPCPYNSIFKTLVK